MDHDEQHLIVLVGQRVLRIEKLIEIEILPIAQRVPQIPIDLLVAQVDERLAGRIRFAHRLILEYP
jgi:hypothetical protein